jgi:alcohol dehydrogenase class IV
MTHAIEGYVSLDWNPHQDGRSIAALRLIRDNLERAVESPEDDPRGNMLIAAYRDLNEVLGLETGGAEADVGETLASHVEGMTERMGLPTRLSQVGVPEEGIPALVEGAMGDGLTLLNPREPTEQDYEELFRRAL